MIVNNMFLIAKLNTFSQGQGGSKSGQNQKKISISDSVTQKLTKGEIKKNPWCDPLISKFVAYFILEHKAKTVYDLKIE